MNVPADMSTTMWLVAAVGQGGHVKTTRKSPSHGGWGHVAHIQI